jgi:hypothetical protein
MKVIRHISLSPLSLSVYTVDVMGALKLTKFCVTILTDFPSANALCSGYE